MKCPRCNSFLLNLYYRKGAGGKVWIPLKTHKYCDRCEKIIKIQKQ